MKRSLAMFVLLSATTALSWTLDMSAGVAAEVASYSSTLRADQSISGSTTSVSLTVAYVPVDAEVFFDATYFQAAVGYQFYYQGSLRLSATGFTSSEVDLNENLSYVVFEGLFKYPVKFGYPYPNERLVYYPLLGARYTLNLTFTDSATGLDLRPYLTSREAEDLNQIWLEAGAGMDVVLRGSYLRFEGIAGYKIPTKTDNEAVAGLQGSLASQGITDVSVSARDLVFGFRLMFGHKLQFSGQT